MPHQCRMTKEDECRMTKQRRLPIRLWAFDIVGHSSFEPQPSGTARPSLDHVLQVEDRQQHADHDRADDRRHHEQQQRLDRRRPASGAGGPGPTRTRRRGGRAPCRAGRSPRRRRSFRRPTRGTVAGCWPGSCDSGVPRCTSSIACSTVSASVWLPIASRATRSDATSGTPAPTSVPSIRQNRTSANRAMTRPSTGVFEQRRGRACAGRPRSWSSCGRSRRRRSARAARNRP